VYGAVVGEASREGEVMGSNPCKREKCRDLRLFFIFNLLFFWSEIVFFENRFAPAAPADRFVGAVGQPPLQMLHL
jgi:hypothetical protein